VLGGFRRGAIRAAGAYGGCRGTPSGGAERWKQGIHGMVTSLLSLAGASLLRTPCAGSPVSLSYTRYPLHIFSITTTSKEIEKAQEKRMSRQKAF